MALWKDQYGREQTTPEPAADKPAAATPVSIESARQPAATQVRTVGSERVAARGGIDDRTQDRRLGHGSTRQLQRQVNVQGNVTIESGAKVTGGDAPTPCDRREWKATSMWHRASVCKRRAEWRPETARHFRAGSRIRGRASSAGRESAAAKVKRPP